MVTRHVRLERFTAGAGLPAGCHVGTTVVGGALGLERPAGTLTYAEPEQPERRTYEWAAWVSAEQDPGFAFTELVPSWNATTPDDSWLTLEARISADGARWSPWHRLAVWAELEHEVHRRSSPAVPRLDVDRTLIDVLRAAPGNAWSRYQLRLTLLRPVGSDASPRVGLVTALASDVPVAAPPLPSPGGAAWGVELAVPPHSQQLHRDTFAQWAGGGEAWCSPSSITMVLEHWGRGPTDKEYAWVPEGGPDPTVVNAARRVYDHGYGGCGNWTFNTAYAGRFGVEAFVTRLRSLTEMESLVAAGIPVVATIAFPEGAIPGTNYGTNGHLVVVRGFTADGDVVLNDPASRRERSNDAVRTVFTRRDFERVWLGASAGVVYLVRPPDVPLPPVPVPSEPGW